MNLQKLCGELDTFFKVSDFNESDGWSHLMADTYRGAFQRFVRSEFIEGTWNGLMLENPAESADVNRVYLVVFPNQNLLDTIIANEVERGAPGALIFTHHVLGYSEAAAAFNPIKIEQLEELREHHISIYVCHAPLDCHLKISTGNALADALGLQEQRRFAPYYGGEAGILGKVNPASFQEFAEKVARVCELPFLRYDQCLHNGKPVQLVAIVPGGGNDADLMKEAATLGADTYVTGHWWLFGESDFARQDREKMRLFLETQALNLVGASHYSSELIVMRDQMPGWFKKHNLETMLIRQTDAWR